jgi:hypothetical protein
MAAKRRCALTQAGSQKSRGTKRKSREEDGMEDGRSERKRWSEKGKGKEKERTEWETEEKEWRATVERRLDGIEREMRVGLGRIMEELERLEKAWEEPSEEGSGEEDGDGGRDEEMRAVEEMVDGEVDGEVGKETEGGGAENGGDVEME